MTDLERAPRPATPRARPVSIIRHGLFALVTVVVLVTATSCDKLREAVDLEAWYASCEAVVDHRHVLLIVESAHEPLHLRPMSMEQWTESEQRAKTLDTCEDELSIDERICIMEATAFRDTFLNCGAGGAHGAGPTEPPTRDPTGPTARAAELGISTGAGGQLGSRVGRQQSCGWATGQRDACADVGAVGMGLTSDGDSGASWLGPSGWARLHE